MKVSRFESAAGWYESVSRDPAPALRPHVHAYWGFEERARTRVRRLEVAFPAVIVMANFAGVIRVGHANGGAGRMTEYRTFVGGLDHGAATTEHDGHIHGIELALSPLGARMVFGVPMDELAQAAAPLDALLGAAAPRLVERLYHAPAWQERFDLLDGFLAERLASAAAAPAEIE